MTQTILQLFYNETDIKTFRDNSQFSISPNSSDIAVYTGTQFVPLYGDGAVQLTSIFNAQTSISIDYKIAVYTYQFEDNTQITGTYSFKSVEGLVNNESKFIYPTTSCTGRFIGKSGYIVVDVRDNRRDVTIVLN